jgi:hypothetical protein
MLEGKLQIGLNLKEEPPDFEVISFHQKTYPRKDS